MSRADASAMPCRFNLLAAVLVGLAVTLPAIAQPSDVRSLSGPGFVEVVDVEVINIDVYVTDADGKPVLGLGPDDFELKVDGRRVPISNFYAVEQQGDDLFVRRGGELTAKPLLPPSDDPLEQRKFAVRQPVTAPPEQALHVVIYIDNLNLTPPNRNRVMRELRAFIREHLVPQDRIMLASFDRYLNLRMPFTNDRDQVRRALLELEEFTGQRVHRNSERRDLFETINDVNTEIENRTDSERRIQAARRYDLTGGGAQAREQLINYAGSVRNETNMAIDGLMRLVQNLSAAPGRKAVVYVADGIPMIAGEDIFYFLHGVWEQAVSLIEMAEYDLSHRFQQLAALANANRVSFYAIDARGLTVYSQAKIDNQVAGLPGQMAQIDTIVRTNLQSPLQLMAEETGGRAILNVNRVMPDLLRVAADFRNYYALGYTPDLVGAGTYHRIEVIWKNKPRRAEVRFRRGYRDKTLESRMIEGTLSVLHLNLLDNPLGARVHALAPKRRPDGNYDVPLVVEVAWTEITLVPRDGVHHGRIQLWIAALDDKDRVTEPQRTDLNIAVPAQRLADVEDGTWRYGLELTMERGYHALGIGIRDDIGGRKSFLRSSVDIR